MNDIVELPDFEKDPFDLEKRPNVHFHDTLELLMNHHMYNNLAYSL